MPQPIEKRFYRTSELVTMGLNKDYLMQIAHMQGQRFAYQPAGKNGSILWDFHELQKHLNKCLVR